MIPSSLVPLRAARFHLYQAVQTDLNVIKKSEHCIITCPLHQIKMRAAFIIEKCLPSWTWTILWELFAWFCVPACARLSALNVQCRSSRLHLVQDDCKSPCLSDSMMHLIFLFRQFMQAWYALLKNWLELSVGDLVFCLGSAMLFEPQVGFV